MIEKTLIAWTCISALTWLGFIAYIIYCVKRGRKRARGVPTMRNPPPPPEFERGVRALDAAIERATVHPGNRVSKRKRVYICGPITGLPDLNRSAFKAAEVRLDFWGFEPVNPHEVCKHHVAGHVGTETELWQACMKADIAELVKCDMVAVLPNADKSRGAKIEIELAVNLGIPVMSLNDFRHETDNN